MHPFASYVLRRYYNATGWNEDDFYGNITRSSNAILDFVVPSGLSLGISKSPNPLFKTSYSVFALPSLHGSLGYIFTSADLNVQNSRDVRIKDLVDHFKVYDQPRRPEGKPEEWRAGERVDTRDYLMYGKVFIPTGKLEALYTTRMSPTVQGFVAAISDPRYTVQPINGHSASNVLLKLQHATGRWCTEYSWSAEDQMWGVQCMYNFGRMASQHTPEDPAKKASKVKRVDEEEAMEGGLKGRISTGAEFYLSTKEKSAGVSAGIRFTTLPDATPPSAQVPSDQNTTTPTPPSQPPTTITAMFNPMLGHMSGAYAAQVSRDLSLCSRFEFNVYSYESEWAVGAEWWTRGHKGHPGTDNAASSPTPSLSPATTPPTDTPAKEVQGVVKARLSTKADVSLMWEGRIRNMLVSLGIRSDLTDRTNPIKAIGLEMSYFSSE